MSSALPFSCKRVAAFWRAVLVCAALPAAPAATQPAVRAVPAPAPISVPLWVPAPLWELPVSALPTPNALAQDVRDAALRFGIPERWIYAVMRAESAGRADATSPVGAMGLMQIMPATWRALSARYALGSDAYAPRANIMGGTAYIREMYDRYGAPGFLAAYNAGPGRYENYLTTGRPLPRETQHYVAKIAPVLGLADGPTLRFASARALPPLRVVTAIQVATPSTQATLFVGHSERMNAALGNTLQSSPAEVIARQRAASHRLEKPSANGLFVPLSRTSL